MIEITTILVIEPKTQIIHKAKFWEIEKTSEYTH